MEKIKSVETVRWTWLPPWTRIYSSKRMVHDRRRWRKNHWWGVSLYRSDCLPDRSRVSGLHERDGVNPKWIRTMRASCWRWRTDRREWSIILPTGPKPPKERVEVFSQERTSSWITSARRKYSAKGFSKLKTSMDKGHKTIPPSD